MVVQNSNASIPVSLLQSNASHGACRTYALLSLLPTQNGRFWVSQGYLANQLNCSTRHVRNFLKELEEAGFLLSTGELQGRKRVYKLLNTTRIDEPALDKGETAKVEEEELKTAPVDFDARGNRVPRIELNLNSKFNLINLSEPVSASQTQAQSLLAKNPAWKTEFQVFDGKEGRPSLLQKIEEAIARFSYGSLLGYVKYYLKTGAQWLLQSLSRLYNLAPKVQPVSLEELQQQRREQEAKRSAYQNRYLSQIKKQLEQSEEDQNFIKNSFASLTKGFRNNLVRWNDL